MTWAHARSDIRLTFVVDSSGGTFSTGWRWFRFGDAASGRRPRNFSPAAHPVCSAVPSGVAFTSLVSYFQFSPRPTFASCLSLLILLRPVLTVRTCQFSAQLPCLHMNQRLQTRFARLRVILNCTSLPPPPTNEVRGRTVSDLDAGGWLNAMDRNRCCRQLQAGEQCDRCDGRNNGDG